MKALGIVLLSALFIVGFTGCEGGDTTVGVGTGGAPVVLNPNDAGTVFNPPPAVQQPAAIQPANCPVRNNQGEIICSCESWLAGQC